MSPVITRINELSQLARQAWFTQLAFLAFIGVTLLSVQDADLLVLSRKTQLPMVGIDIPICWFLVFAPILGTVLYVNLHLYLAKLWRVLEEAPPQVEGVPLADLISSWPVNDFALDLRRDTCPHDTRMMQIRRFVMFVLVWAAAPLVFSMFLHRSMVLHSLWISPLMLLALCVCVGFGYDSWMQARHRLAGRPSHLSTHPIWTRSAAVGLLAAGAAVCLARTGNVPSTVQITIGSAVADVPATPQDPAPISAVAAVLDIAGEELVELPSGWKPLSELRRDFWTTWCARQPGCAGLATATEQAVTNPLRVEFQAEWRAVSRRVVDNLPQLDLSGRDLRGARADRAVLSGAVMDRIDLAHAKLREANMEGAVLTRGRLVWLQAYDAHFEGANLTGSDVRRAQLSSARLDDASLHFANLTGADLRNARLKGANFKGTILKGADLRSAHDLTQDQLADAIGDERTLLPLSPDGGETLYVQSCWNEAEPVDQVLLNPYYGDSERADILQLRCKTGKAPKRTGRLCAEDAEEPHCVPVEPIGIARAGDTKGAEFAVAPKPRR